MKLRRDADNPSNCPLSLWKHALVCTHTLTRARGKACIGRVGVGISSADPSLFLSLFFDVGKESSSFVKGEEKPERDDAYDVNDRLLSLSFSRGSFQRAGCADYRPYIVRIGPQPVIEHRVVNLTPLVNYAAAAFSDRAISLLPSARARAHYLEQ